MAEEKSIRKLCDRHSFVSGENVLFGGFTANLTCGNCGKPITVRCPSGGQFTAMAESNRLFGCTCCGAYAGIECAPIPRPKEMK